MWLLLLIILLMPYETSPYLYLADNFLGILPDFTVIKLLGLVGFVGALFSLASGWLPEGLLASRQGRMFGLFVLGVVVAGLLSGSGLLPISRYMLFLMFLPFVLITVRTHEDFRAVLAMMVLSLAITVPYGLRQMVRYESRMGVGLYEPNYLAANLVLVIPVALALAASQPRRPTRLLWVGAAVLLVASLYLTSSRGGFLGLLVAALVFVYRRRGPAAAAGALALLVVAVIPTGLGERAAATLFPSAEAPPGLEASNEAHVALFWAALRMISEAPLTGVGPYNFKDLSQAYSGLDRPAIAHNTFLELAAEAGIPVLLLFLLLLAAVFAAFRRAQAAAGTGPQAAERALLAEGLRGGLLGFLVAAGFISAQYEKWFWLVVFLSIVLDRLTARAAAPAGAEAPPPAVPAWQRA